MANEHEKPRIGIVWMPDIEDWAICGYDPNRGKWIVIEARPAFELGPGRLPDIIEPTWPDAPPDQPS